jgi:hypothetical protein
MRGGLVVTGGGSGREALTEPVVSLRMADGSEVHRPLRDVQARQVVAAVPWRGTRSARGQAQYPGYYWSATTSSHVIYESRLELVSAYNLMCRAGYGLMCRDSCTSLPANHARRSMAMWAGPHTGAEPREVTSAGRDLSRPLPFLDAI